MKVVVAGNMLTNVRSFIILQSGEGLTFFNKHNSAIFSKEKKYNEAQFRGGGCLFFGYNIRMIHAAGVFNFRCS